MSHVAVRESQPWDHGSNYDSVKANGRDKIMNRTKRAKRRW